MDIPNPPDESNREMLGEPLSSPPPLELPPRPYDSPPPTAPLPETMLNTPLALVKAAVIEHEQRSARLADEAPELARLTSLLDVARYDADRAVERMRSLEMQIETLAGPRPALERLQSLTQVEVDIPFVSEGMYRIARVPTTSLTTLPLEVVAKNVDVDTLRRITDEVRRRDEIHVYPDLHSPAPKRLRSS